MVVFDFFNPDMRVEFLKKEGQQNEVTSILK